MKNILFLISSFALLLSCNSNDDDITEQQVDNTSFYALKVGNTWNYKHYDYNADTEEFIDTGISEQVEITGKETIYNDEYFVIKTTTVGNDNTLNYFPDNGVKITYNRVYEYSLVAETNRLIFYTNNFDETMLAFSDGYFSKINPEALIRSVNAGDFNCLEMDIYRKNDAGEIIGNRSKRYYSDGIGLINTISIRPTQNRLTEKRLESYSIQ
ncbi:hypothetical protein [Lacinutrix sp. Bg11-31]|uniref:hypothetical protein n=1 Tax=Lacinutrix sp. Bg11-31 TaxID=2057808 RepID=UPI000C30FA4B|nr:hypothetical protein [Lacinutrix sp. Bg11-31]AUC82356.1 hypothetical protein CW733_09505 [Lacinutrix sp. Bg11-31]